MQNVAEELCAIINGLVPRLHAIANAPDLAVRSQPKKWSRKEILGHLIDSACNNQQKFVRMMQQDDLEFPGYAQDSWVELQDWSKADWSNMVQLWESYNRHIAYLIATIDPQYYQHTITIEGVGPFTLEFIMPDYVEHLKHHLKQIFPDIELSNRFVNVYNA